MGAANSTTLELYTAQEVADHVASLGDKYEDYAKMVKANGMDGEFLLSLTKETFEETLNCMNVTQRLHRRKLERELNKVVSGDNRLTNNSHGFSTAESTLSDSSASGSGQPQSNKSLLCSESVSSGEGSSKSHTSGSNISGSSKPKKSRHRRKPSDVQIDMVMETALAAKQIDAVTPESTQAFVPAVLEAALQAQALENQTLQQDLLQLETERTIDSPPEGENIAIVLTDVEGSTALWEANPEAMKEALDIHDEIQRRLREKHMGYEIDTEGDAFFLAFSDAADALAFALDLQVSLHEASWSDEILACPHGRDNGERRGLKVRVSIHMGPVETLNNPVTGRILYHGQGYDVAQQIEEFARGGQILTTADTWTAAFHMAETKLGSPVLKEGNKLLVMEDAGDSGSENHQSYTSLDQSDRSSLDRSSTARSSSRNTRRLVEIAPASLPNLTDATLLTCAKNPQPKRSQLAQALMTLLAEAAKAGLDARCPASTTKIPSSLRNQNSLKDVFDPTSSNTRAMTRGRDVSPVKV